MNEEDNAYEILGVPTSASQAEIKKAHYRLCREWHPDMAKNEEDVRARTQMMYRINDAREILLDPDKRAQHDAELKEEGDPWKSKVAASPAQPR